MHGTEITALLKSHDNSFSITDPLSEKSGGLPFRGEYYVFLAVL